MGGKYSCQGGGGGEIGAAGRKVKEYRNTIEVLDREEIHGFCGTSDPNKSQKQLHPVK